MGAQIVWEEEMNNRRKLILAFSAGALAASFNALAQQASKVIRVGVLIGFAEDDPDARLRLAAFKEGLAVLGWVDGRNLRMDIRWSAGDVTRAAAYAKELVALHPEVILAISTPATAALKRETQIIPIVFTTVSDPVGSGFAKSLAHPGANITGFINLESSMAEKWLQLLKEIAPRVTRVAVMFNPDTAPYAEYYLRPLKVAAPKLGVNAYSAIVRGEPDIQKAIDELGREPNGGLIAMADSFINVHRVSIIGLTVQQKIPAIYPITNMAAEGGLLAYGIDNADLHRRAATHIDKILKGAKAGDLPVEQPTKFDLVVNQRTAKALGIKIPQSILVQATKVIE
jgi:putative ABC transport system substrate-binding protein